ncbi:MAG: hypothetical protein A2287_05275 [Candidatus Melainabacteria bacterium RIFOXYA12_FULL_32_12]|nr:MAG: hypothetical protein A2287_05275 [Candidatus Melainabacteria bacterium RIFOXYA12_FULL_32_12]
MLNAKKYFTFYLLICFIYFSFVQASFAFDQSKVIMEAEKINLQNLVGEVDKRILKKYIPVRITVTNKNNAKVQLSNKVYYFTEDGKKYIIPSSAVIFEKTKRHTIRRAVLAAIPVTLVTFLILTPAAMGGVIAYCSSANGKLEDNIKKHNLKPRHLFEDDSHSAYVFIPKKYKGVSEIIIKDVIFNDEQTFDLRAPISDEYLN